MSQEIKVSVLGLMAAAGSAVCFSVIDVIFKFLSGDYPLYQVVMVRSIVALVVLGAVIIPLEGGFHILRTRQPKLHLMRCCAVLFANICFFTGLAIMPIAEAVAIAFATPLIVTALSVVVLKERVGPWRWGAVAAGFLGVLIIMRPGPGSFQAAAILPFLGACGYATLHVLTRRAGGAEKASTLSFYPTLGFLVVSALVGLTTGDGRFASGDSAAVDYILRAWVWPAPQDWGLFVGVGLAGSIGGYLVSQAYRLNEAGLAAPFEYVAMPMAVLWGVLVFDEWPDVPVWAGSALIIGAGLVSVWRETRRSRPVPRPRPRSAG
ncbi:DMT family transporter [Phaeobacter sp. QD34_3]|uniref:DMT family transporter n=1 Tax=unclassified Phaeobacter TaxID=2621772 RepID=UPI00237F43E9|nr:MULTISPECIES: DMT family transporter [unclassified Phaeobacter]MDE4133448.1 DMT family transporter [Phaeobacter sp. QD34_3]MDE4137084.1 DMT family transporter [Phaeobacter sp. QD34_24]MDE4175312.1 DMT family transporter [Phaeobacter sp. PT47_59]